MLISYFVQADTDFEVSLKFWQVFTARLEANDNMKYLRTLEDWFDKLNDDGDFPKLLEVRHTLRQQNTRV